MPTSAWACVYRPHAHADVGMANFALRSEDSASRLNIHTITAMNETAILGLDVGGANLKAAHCDGTAVTVPFPLWKHPDQLTARLRTIRAQMPPHDRIALTMTGELCDCFESKRAG